MASVGFIYIKLSIRVILINFIYACFNRIVQCDENNLFQTQRQNHLLLRHPREADSDSFSSYSFGTAVSFGGRNEFLKLQLNDDVTLPNTEFSVQLWIKPEGGQYRYTPIIDVFEDCSKHGGTGWTVGIKLPRYSRHDARFVFSLHTDGATTTSDLQAHKAYEHNTWTNIAATYDGMNMKLYMNGAEVTLKGEQVGDIFGKSVANCAGLFVGGRPRDEVYYRGKIDEFSLWKRALSHAEIVSNINKRSSDFSATTGLIASDAFGDLVNWEIQSMEEPAIVVSDIVLPHHTVRLEAPSCGRTVCDDPEVVLNYVNNRKLRNKKEVRYRIINIYDDNGRNPLVSDKQVHEQHRLLNKAFEPYNISMEVDIIRVRNTSLLQKVFMFDCHPNQIGDGHCDQECAHSTTGNDGGDCDHVTSECKKALLSNGQCNAECNKAYHHYDNGDCCKPGDENTYLACVDPNRQHRGYMHIEELKLELQIPGDHVINVFFITSAWNTDTFRGLATYPWEKNVYSTMGGIVLHVDVFTNIDKAKALLVHEFGHVFGLWHVHRGISEMSCDDTCAETHPSMVLGDMCSDTNPTPRNSFCRDPPYDPQQDMCGHNRFENTPFTNYMSYTDDACIDQFTHQQEARMHCYLDLVYQPMRKMNQPTPIPISPKVIQADETSVHIVWLKPLGLDRGCGSNNALYQHASTATASHNGVRWAPHEATGFPDAETCKPSRYAWKPYHSNIHPGCDFDSCWLELGFQEPVIPKRVSVWIADIREDTDIYLEMIATDGETVEIGDVPAYCDMETTITVHTDKLINRVKIHTVDSYIAIDAVEIVSTSDFPACLSRKLPQYEVVRYPGFPGGVVITETTQLTDTTVEFGVNYTYSVRVIEQSKYSVTSPELIYTHGSPFCGDGLTNSEEECDDNNAVDGDGCSMECKLEERFKCKGSPSLCSISPNEDCDDGKQICGLSAPRGFYDQWAVDANANPEYKGAECPASMVTGKPDKIQKCESRPVHNFWRPCAEFLDVSGDFWIQVHIYKPVVATSVIIHLASDGRSVFSQDRKSIHVQLIRTDESIVSITPTSVPVTCEDSPIQIPVVQDLSKPFLLTTGVRISFTSSSIGFYAFRVRSSPYINPPGISSCTDNELYYPLHGVCVSGKCSSGKCDEFPVKYGEAVCSGLEDGDSCKIQCDKGYLVDGHENRAVCVDGAWITSSPLICSPVDCGRPSVHLATAACTEGTTFSKQCHFKCDRPASLLGEDTSLTCLRNGRWSKTKATCIVQCDSLDPIAYDNGKLKTSSCIKGSQSVGQQCKVRCQEGYHVQDERIKRRFLRIICDEDGEWFGPKCIQNMCPSLPRMFTGAYTCTNGFQSGSTCTLSCPDDLTMFQSVTCTKTGGWNGELTVCSIDATKTCPVPTPSGHVTFDCDRNNPGDECPVACPDGHNPVIGNSQPSNVNEQKQFEYTDRMECTVLQKWEPSPDQFICIQPCTMWSIGDGFCDAINNRDVCDWDGGDCCPSSVHGGMVLPIPEDCLMECKCNDPLAIENRRRKRRHKHPFWKRA